MLGQFEGKFPKQTINQEVKVGNQKGEGFMEVRGSLQAELQSLQ